ncbi:MAG: hypothetical protein ABW154_01520 [Dyella sp.]
MKYELLLMRGLLVVCMLLCLGVLGSMVTLTPQSAAPIVQSVQLTQGDAACVLPPDGVICLSAQAG